MEPFRAHCQAVSPAALDDLVSGERESPAVVELLELAAVVPLTALHPLIQELQDADHMWLQGADVERFLGLIVGLLASRNPEVTCAAASVFLVALRCLSNGSPGLFHPLALHELCKALPGVLCAGETEAAAPCKSSKSSRKKTQESDEEGDEETGNATQALPAAAADGLAEQLCAFLEAVPLAAYPETLSQFVAALVEAAARGAGRRVYLPLTCCLGPEHGELVRSCHRHGSKRVRGPICNHSAHHDVSFAL